MSTANPNTVKASDPTVLRSGAGSVDCVGILSVASVVAAGTGAETISCASSIVNDPLTLAASGSETITASAALSP